MSRRRLHGDMRCLYSISLHSWHQSFAMLFVFAHAPMIVWPTFIRESQPLQTDITIWVAARFVIWGAQQNLKSHTCKMIGTLLSWLKSLLRKPTLEMYLEKIKTKKVEHWIFRTKFHTVIKECNLIQTEIATYLRYRLKLISEYVTYPAFDI